MQRLGFTRSASQANHLLSTPDTFVRAPRPGMRNATAIVHISAAGGARFTQYTAEFEPGGCLGPADGERFVYVLEGEVQMEGWTRGPGGYAYFPPGNDRRISASRTARAAVIEKRYDGAEAPAMFFGEESTAPTRLLLDDPDVQVRVLIPEVPAFDLAVNTMTFQPGASLPMVEVHVMEHGLLMLEGGGIYRLGDNWYPSAAGDFIWMAPYCPQWFGAIGKTPAKYLIYKDWNR